MQLDIVGTLHSAVLMDLSKDRAETAMYNIVYEVNSWLWTFGRPQPRFACLSLAETEKIRKRCRGEAPAAEAQVADDI
jgi:hypothetical protein